MYEVEFKVEITAAERETVVAKLLQRNFADKGTVAQVDYYVEAVESPYGGFDTRRLRDEAGTLLYTKKVWELMDGVMMRREEEREVTKEEWEDILNTATKPLTIKKDRQSFSGHYKDKKIHIDMDTVKFDHSPSIRHFIETELLTENKEEVKELREFVRDFLRELLEKEEVIEASGMFSMAYQKL